MSLSITQIEAQAQAVGLQLDLSHCLAVDTKQQVMYEFKNRQLVHRYVVSTAKAGTGNQEGSYQTPLGFHKVAEKIGAGCEINSLFKARKFTGEIAQIDDPEFTQTDCITSRILWLSGLQVGVNLQGEVDSKNRYIYIHGTADEKHLGEAVSKGCIRMKNTDIVALFDAVQQNTVVYIY